MTPFLERGASHPVRWLPWGASALERARSEGKPLLAVVGASWSFPCQLLDEEAFRDSDVASVLDARYVAVRIDRDERPDLDARLQSWGFPVTGQSGWPYLAFLAPDGTLFFGGSRFSKAPAHGRPPLAEVLADAAEMARLFPARAASTGEEAGNRLRSRDGDLAAGPKDRPREGILAALHAAYDAHHGGFGDFPKFLLPAAAEWLVARSQEGGNEEALSMARASLAAMEGGAVHDRLGGGFHRMARQEDWIEPRFEKRLWDNARMLSLFAKGAGLDPRFAEAARACAGFILKDLALPARGGGGFAASVAAAAPGEPDEGRFYGWTAAQLRAAAGEREVAFLAERFGWARKGGKLGSHRLWPALRRSLDEAAHGIGATRREAESLEAKGIAALAAARAKRKPPPRDPTPYAGANARAARALLEASTPLGLGADARKSALGALARILFREKEGLVPHRLDGGEGPFYSADLAETGLACLAAAAQGEQGMLEPARRLADALLSRFRDAERGGLRDVLLASPDPVVERFPLRPVFDLPDPGANGLAIRLFARLGKALGSQGGAYSQAAREACTALGSSVSVYGPFAGEMALAIEEAI